jgi:hypothetical protein
MDIEKSRKHKKGPTIMSEQGPAFNPFEEGSDVKPATVVDDKDKAEVMAHASNESRTNAAQLRRMGSMLIDEFVNNPNSATAGLEHRKKELVEAMNNSEGKDKAVQSELNDVHAALRMHKTGDSVQTTIKTVKDQLDYTEKQADQAEDAAGSRHDQAKEMRAALGIKEK